MLPLDVGLELAKSLGSRIVDHGGNASGISTASVPFGDVSQVALSIGGIGDGLNEVESTAIGGAGRGDGLLDVLEEVAFDQNMGVLADIQGMTIDVLSFKVSFGAFD